MRLSLQATCAAAAAALVACGPAQAGLTYLSQERFVEAQAGSGDFDEPGQFVIENENKTSAPGFDPFTAIVEAIFDEGDGDNAFARATQESALTSTGFTASGTLFAGSGDLSARARTRFAVEFDVTAATDVAFSLTADYEVSSSAFADRERAAFSLRRVDDAGDVVLFDEALTGDELNTPDDGQPFAFTFDESVDAGRYAFAFDAAAFSYRSGGDEGAFDFSLTAADDDGGNGTPIPLPPAAWAGLGTFACYGASRLLGRRLRRA